MLHFKQVMLESITKVYQITFANHDHTNQGESYIPKCNYGHDFLHIDLFMVYWTQYIDEVRWAMELKWYMAIWSFSKSYSQQHFAKTL
jgi:hypothetical protein